MAATSSITEDGHHAIAGTPFEITSAFKRLATRCLMILAAPVVLDPKGDLRCEPSNI
jgi:hypothetical protein